MTAVIAGMDTARLIRKRIHQILRTASGKHNDEIQLAHLLLAEIVPGFRAMLIVVTSHSMSRLRQGPHHKLRLLFLCGFRIFCGAKCCKLIRPLRRRAAFLFVPQDTNRSLTDQVNIIFSA